MVLSHPNSNEPNDKEILNSVIQGPYDSKKELFEISSQNSNKKEVVYLINRLDAGTSGQ